MSSNKTNSPIAIPPIPAASAAASPPNRWNPNSGAKTVAKGLLMKPVVKW